MADLLDQIWELDKEDSYATLTIVPIKEGDVRCWELRERIQISPYPNPFGYGGQRGMGRTRDEAEIEQEINRFYGYLHEWKKHGLEKIEVVREPEMTRAEHINKIRQEHEASYPTITSGKLQLQLM